MTITIFRAVKNSELFANMEQEGTLVRDDAMEDVLMEIVKDRVDEKVNEKEQETKSLDISSLMTNLKLTLEQAMDA